MALSKILRRCERGSIIGHERMVMTLIDVVELGYLKNICEICDGIAPQVENPKNRIIKVKELRQVDASIISSVAFREMLLE